MKQEEQVSRTTKQNPYGVRIPGAAVGIACGFVVLMRSPGHITETDAIFIIAATLVMFFKPKDRPFWFFAGIAFAGLLIQALPQLHSLFGVWPRSVGK